MNQTGWVQRSPCATRTTNELFSDLISATSILEEVCVELRTFKFGGHRSRTAGDEYKNHPRGARRTVEEGSADGVGRWRCMSRQKH